MSGNSLKKSGSSGRQTDKATSAPPGDMTDAANARPLAGEAGESSAVAETGIDDGKEDNEKDDDSPVIDDGKENSDKDSASHVADSEVSGSHKSKAVFAADEPQNGPHTSSSVNGSASGPWQQKACKDVVPRKLENEPFPGGRAMSKLGLGYAIGPDKVPTVFTNEHNLWSGTPQVISYYFMGGTKLQHEKVAKAIEEWTWYANVRFAEVSLPENSNVRITFNPNDGSWSYIGRQCDSIPVKEATMNLAWLDKFSDITGNEKAVILHEFGHALGLLHEHQSPAHGGKAVKDVEAALELYKRTQGWTTQQIYDQVINVYNKSDVSNYSQVDIHSIMHYPQPKELTGLKEDIPYNEKLTDLDKAYMILQYPRKTMHDKAKEDGWSIEQALKVIGAPPDVTRKVLNFVEEDCDDFGEISPVNIREVIKNWTRTTYGLTQGGPSSALREVDEKNPTPLRGVQPPSTGPPNAQVPDTTPASVSPDTGTKSFIYQLYDKLSTLYCPGGGQYFALQFPTRFLDKDTFAYELDGNFSRFNKPVVVNEAEFNLTDALYPISPIVGGPNGQTLSRNYSKAVNSLIPTFESTEVRKQRERMRKWLLKETKKGNAAYTVDTRLVIPGLSTESAKKLAERNGMNITAGDERTGPLADQAEAMRMAQQAIEMVKNSERDSPRIMTRMEFSETLMHAYLRDRQEWEERKDKMITEVSHLAASDPRAMNDLTRRLAHISALEEAKLGAKYGDAVVRGYSHTVRGFLGHLDIKSVAESLQDAKDSLRESSLSSLYTASLVYPVAMQPTDWFQALDTGFTREELSQDPSLIKAAIRAKSQLIDNLENQIANLRGFNKGDPAAAKLAMSEAAAQREAAIAKMSREYTASTISAVKLAISATAGPAVAAIGEVMKKPDGDEDKKSLLAAGIKTADLEEIGKQMDEVSKANAAVNSASRELTEHMSDYSLAIAGDTRTMVDGLQRQLTTAKQELSELQESYTIAKRDITKTAGSPAGKLEDIGNLPPGNGGSRWNEIHVKSNVSNDYTKSMKEEGSKVEDFNCNFWIGSYSKNESESQAKVASDSGSNTLSIDVSMRVTYVTVDRSGWFDPALLEMSKSFMKGSKTNDYTPWTSWKTGHKIEDAAKAITDNAQEKKPEGYLVAFPVGYIIVKDCVIKVSSSSSQGKSMKEFIDKQSQSSGGFLCFSHSSASRSSSDSSSSSTSSASDGVVIRIPGPQILGYIMQLTGQDQSQNFSEVPLEDLFPEDEEETPQTGPARASALRPDVPPSGTPAKGRTVRSYEEKEPETTPQGSSAARPPVPAHGVQGTMPGAAASKPGHIVDALRMALEGSEFADWAGQQPDNVKEEIMAKVIEAFGGAVDRKQG
ncbi:hypothetical protein FANTH_8583 [Fusarium anthophilum]|uniref:Peptidase metallopeptidase domain-containing protein n=1 Tax=Fusarium anthophilum TaxID=48485 RepID=A0A8H5E0F4_9HYPO|nr:hypothetical protein FANTH_8583 [Fusarium anthophilum]